jgi:3'-phosphoadenosine 5'-phosphosulfate sulfotransferase (PAPS reductase)/FAD synthetase
MDLEHKAIERIRTASEMSLHHYGKPLVCKYSGGKDSDVMLELFKRSGVPFEVSHGLTTVDAPPTVRHIKDTFKRLEDNGIKATIHKPKLSMWRLIEKKKFPPTRTYRYCCSEYKENQNRGRMIATGVRWDESTARANRQAFETIGRTKKTAIRLSEKMLMEDSDERRALFEKCELKAQTVVNPIIDWGDADVWDFYWNECPAHNPLYSMGYIRAGCVGCPMASPKYRWKEFADFPKYKDAYIWTFERMLEAIHAEGKPTKWKSGYDVFLWWMEDQNVEGQISLEELYDLEQ